MTHKNNFIKKESKEIASIPQANNWDEAKNFLKSYLSIELSEIQESKLKQFHNILQETNKVINLTRLDSLPDFLTFHLIDTALLIPTIRELKFPSRKTINYLDLGSGCGVPGIILHILLNKGLSPSPSLKLEEDNKAKKSSEVKTTLVDSVSKRTRFLNKVIEELELDCIEVITCRVESLIDKHKQFDLVTARAFAKPPVAVKMAKPFLNKHGYFLAQTTEVNEKNKQRFEYKLAEKKRLIATIN